MANKMLKPLALTIPITCTAALLAATVAHAAPFRNITNQAFASRCNGPQGAVVIPDDAVSVAQARASALRRQHDPGKLAHAAATMRRLQRLGLHNPRARLRLPRLAVHTVGGKLVLPDLARSMAVGDLGSPANQLTFEFEGWSEPDKALLEAYLAAAYPKARLVYGAPAFNITVKIIRDDTITELQGGIYDATANEIRMPSLIGNVPEDTFILMLLVLRAFHDDVALFYDAWEEGFVGAAATAVQVQPGVSPDFDPKDPGPFYALSVYEAENHPELGNSTFYPEGDFGGMMVWRIAMARAAWMKCWIEDEGFFANFNQLYYNEFAAELPGDVPRLREIAAGALPTVEGLPFGEWFERQYVLDTSVRMDLKEYTWNIPLESAVVLIAEHYLTDDSGNEFARGGQARTIYWSYDFSVNLYAEEGNLIDIPVTGDTPGEGFLIPTFFNIGGPQRVTVQLDLNGLRSHYPYPYGVRGFDPGQNNLYGGILNETTGEINVTGGDGIAGLKVRRGAWGDIITSGDLRPLKLTATFTNPDGQEIARQVNVGWDSYMILLDGGAQTTLTHTFRRGITGLHMMALPVTPVLGSAPEALGIAAADLLLARWRPELPPEGSYEVWPNCEPLVAGRGFWLRVLKDVTTQVTGVKPPEHDRIYVSLDLGWNMFGSVRLDPLATDSLKVQVGTEAPVSLADAVDKRYVQKGIFGYQQASGYSLVDTIEPFEGYWIRSLTPGGCRLAFEPLQTGTSGARDERLVGAASSRDPRGAAIEVAALRLRSGQAGSRSYGTKAYGTKATASGALRWKLPLVVEAGWMRSAGAYLGGAPDATADIDRHYDVQGPPPFGPYVSARFVRKDGGGDRAYLTDVRGDDPAGETWELEVTGTLPDQAVRLSWPNLSELPSHLRPILVDSSSNKRLYMRTTSGYTIPADADGVLRRLRIEMPGPEAQTLVITSMAARPQRGAVSLAYSISREASVRARVLNIAGRPVRVLLADRIQPAGANVTTWNLTDDRGMKAPNGMYLFEVEARSEEGQSVRAVRSVRVSRR